MYAFFDNIVREVAGPGTRPGGCFQFRRPNARDCPPSHRGDAVRAGERLKLAHDVATWFALDDILDSDDSDYASEDEDLKDTLLFSVGEQLNRPLRRSQYPALDRTNSGKSIADYTNQERLDYSRWDKRNLGILFTELNVPARIQAITTGNVFDSETAFLAMMRRSATINRLIDLRMEFNMEPNEVSYAASAMTKWTDVMSVHRVLVLLVLWEAVDILDGRDSGELVAGWQFFLIF